MTNLLQSSEVLYWKPSECRRNFGDYISALFLDRMLVAPRVRASRYRLIGSIIDEENIERDLGEIKDGGNIAYWGCGARDISKIRPDLLERCKFFGVRGPLTRDLLGLPSNTVLGDPALLLPLLRPAASAKYRHGKTICVPHIFEPKSNEELAAQTGAEQVLRADIAPTLKALDRLIDQITGADFVLAGAMHAAIVAHAYGVPFAFFDTGHLDIPFKWRDFAASIGIPVVFVNNIHDGRTAYEDLIRNKAKRIPLSPLLATCPYYVQPSVLLKAAALDAGLKVDARLITALRCAGFESRAYAEAAEQSDYVRNVRLRARFEQQENAIAAAEKALAATTDRLHAAQGALAVLEQESRAALDAHAVKEVELAEADRRRAHAEVECGRWMADAEYLSGELSTLRQISAALSRDLDASRKATAELDAELEAQRRESDAKLVASEAKLGAAEAKIHTLRANADRLDTELSEFARRVSALESDKSSLSHALDEAQRRGRDLAFESRLKDSALPRGKQGVFAPLALELQLAAARLAARRGRWGVAERRYGELLLRLPQNPRLLVQYGHALKEQGELELAASAYNRAFHLRAADCDVAEHLVFALRATGQEAAADAIAREAAQGGDVVISPSQPRAERPPARLASLLSPFLRLEAIRAAKSGNWARAAHKYDALVRAAPGHALYWVQYGHALKEAGRHRDALAAYSTALRLDPTRADAHLQLGHALKVVGRHADAERAYGQAFQLAPSDIRARRELEWMGKAQADLIQLVLDGGEARLQRSARTPISGLLGIALAKFAAKRRDWPAAANRYRRLLARSSCDWRIWVQLGHALKEQGRLVEAEGAYLQALVLEVGDPDLHLQLGHVLKLRGFRKEAAAAYARASRLDPRLEEARREYEAISREEGRAPTVAGSALSYTSLSASVFALAPAEERRHRSSPEVEKDLRPLLKRAPVLCRELGLSSREAKLLGELMTALDRVA